MKQQTYSIPNIMCDHCVMTIKDELFKIRGVTKVKGDPETKTIMVEMYSPATSDVITATLKNIKFPAV